MKSIVNFVLAISVTATLSSCAAKDPAPQIEAPPRHVTGLITEIEAGTMSVRSQDNSKQFIFSLENSPVEVEHLQEHMDQRLPIAVTYRVEGSRLIPITIDDA